MVDVRIVLFDGGPAVTSGIDLGLQPSPACRGRGSTDPERLFGLERRGTPWVAA